MKRIHSRRHLLSGSGTLSDELSRLGRVRNASGQSSQARKADWRRSVTGFSTLEADYGLGSGHELDSPSSVLEGSVPVLGDGFLVLLGQKKVVVVATEPHRLGVVEEVHPRMDMIEVKPLLFSDWIFLTCGEGELRK
ncbi:hypothetical protein SLEP1_g24641 [Rubroshorea leprosula]|uniref:Uncharacterized protein n=1 Tax=Rubroshorea leprosula TaxID=152421 RepID=A0AAV5JGJ2_9ROSI|nr:hypothetical protein SLEP1_g24641 [Rubroshorea leprosula]